MDFKLVYEKDGIICGSKQNIPTENDAEIISRAELEGCKLVYFVDGKFMGSKTDAIPSEDDVLLYDTNAAAEETEDEVEQADDNSVSETSTQEESTTETEDVTEDVIEDVTEDESVVEVETDETEDI